MVAVVVVGSATVSRHTTFVVVPELASVMAAATLSPASVIPAATAI